MITFDKVTKEYRNRKFLRPAKVNRGVKELSFSIEEGAFGLLGVNGAGKTTTLKMVATLLRPSEGTISINGRDSIRYEKELRREINMITGSDRMLYFRLTGRENLMYFASLYGLGRKESLKKAEGLLELTGLTEAADERVERYSRGMKQRLSIARGLINDPKLLLLDEPTLGLDVTIAREIRTFIRDRILGSPGRTVILTSHYMNEIEELCPRIGILDEGELIYQGDLESLYRRIGLEEIHRFRLPAEYRDRHAILSQTAGTRIDWKEDEEGLFGFSLTRDQGFRLLKGMDHLELEGWHYSQEKPGLEEALIMLSKAGTVG